MIYGIIEEGDWSYIKIGYAKSPNEEADSNAAIARGSTLQTGNRRDLLVVCMCAGSLKDERSLHQSFARHRTTGEWFAVTGIVSEWAAANKVSLPLRVRVRAPVQSVPYGPVAPRGARQACLRCEQWCGDCKCTRSVQVTLLRGQSIDKGHTIGVRQTEADLEMARAARRIDMRAKQWEWRGKTRGRLVAARRDRIVRLSDPDHPFNEGMSAFQRSYQGLWKKSG